MTRKYADDAEEAASIIAWTDRRLSTATHSSAVNTYVGMFMQMWRESFGTSDNIPSEFKDRVTAQYIELKAKEWNGEVPDNVGEETAEENRTQTEG